MFLIPVHPAGERTPRPIPVSSADKPEIPDELLRKWERMLSVFARMMDVPVGLVMQVREGQIEVLGSARLPHNPYKSGDAAPLQTGLYCETVMASRAPLEVPDALADPVWGSNPDIDHGLISYLGLPVLWPDGEIFGTVCVLDSKARAYKPIEHELLAEARSRIEDGLADLLKIHGLSNEAARREIEIREIHHRIKNHFNFLVGSLALQEKHEDPAVAFHAFESRVMALSLLHEKLHRASILEQTDLGEYLRDLAESLIGQAPFKMIELVEDMESIFVGPQISLPCGLLVNECVTNSIRHAFKNTVAPSIRLSLKKSPENLLTLSYQDNGPGLPPAAPEGAPSTSLGLLLIHEFARDLKASLSFPQGNGFHCEVTFPVPKSL